MDQPQNFTPPDPSATVVMRGDSEKKRIKINKNLFLIPFLLIFLAGLVFSLSRFTSLFSKAAEEGCLPKNVQAVDLTPNSADITFQTDKACQLQVAYGTSNQSEALLLQVPESMALLNHRVRLSPLLPATAYYYQIINEEKPIGEIYSLLTLPIPKLPTPQPTQVPTLAPVPTVTEISGAALFTQEDFQSNYGTSMASFDIDKNGIVNLQDWLAYEKLHQ